MKDTDYLIQQLEEGHKYIIFIDHHVLTQADIANLSKAISRTSIQGVVVLIEGNPHESVMIEEGIAIENEGESPDHVYYSYDGSPLRSLNCSCEKCIDYFANI